MACCIQHYGRLAVKTRDPDRIQVIVRNGHRRAEVLQQVQQRYPRGMGSLRVETFISFVGGMLREYWHAIPGVPLRYGLDPQVLPKDLTQFLLSRACEGCAQHTKVFEKSGIPDFQVWDQLSSAAYVAGASGLDPQEISPRLVQAWPEPGDEGKVACLQAVSCCVQRLREAVLEVGSLDYGTQLALFERWILPLPEFWQSFDHLIVDQVEDSSAVAVRFYEQAIQRLTSVLFTYTLAGGTALTGIPAQVEQMLCQQTQIQWIEAAVPLPFLRVGQSFYEQLTSEISQGGETLMQQAWRRFLPAGSLLDPQVKLSLIEAETQLEAAEAVVSQVQTLIAEGVDPTRIAILAPRLEPPLLMTVTRQLADLPLLVATPLPALVNYPLVRAMLTLLELLYPQKVPTLSEMEVFLGGVLELDPVRAQLLARDVYNPEGQPSQGYLQPAKAVSQPERVGFATLQRYDKILAWIQAHQGIDQPLVSTLSQFVQQQMATQLHQTQARMLLKNLISLADRFEKTLPHLPRRLFVTMLLSAQTQTPAQDGWDPDYTKHLVVATPMNYLSLGLSADHLIWFDITSSAWSRSWWRALFNAQVLTPAWDGEVFDDVQDRFERRHTLGKLALSLCCRARQGIHGVRAGYDMRGREQLGDLDRVVRRTLKMMRGQHNQR